MVESFFLTEFVSAYACMGLQNAMLEWPCALTRLGLIFISYPHFASLEVFPIRFPVASTQFYFSHSKFCPRLTDLALKILNFILFARNIFSHNYYFHPSPRIIFFEKWNVPNKQMLVHKIRLWALKACYFFIWFLSSWINPTNFI